MTLRACKSLDVLQFGGQIGSNFLSGVEYCSGFDDSLVDASLLIHTLPPSCSLRSVHFSIHIATWSPVAHIKLPDYKWHLIASALDGLAHLKEVKIALRGDKVVMPTTEAPIDRRAHPQKLDQFDGLVQRGVDIRIEWDSS